jgi:hypothetical protein
MTARPCHLSAASPLPVSVPGRVCTKARLRQRASAPGHVCTRARMHLHSARPYLVAVRPYLVSGCAGRRVCGSPGRAISHLVPHIRDIWSRSAHDRPSAASRRSSERSLREFVNDYSADVVMPFYIVTRSLDEAIGDRRPSADRPLMHGQADKRLTHRHSSDGAARKARTGRCLAARTGETDQEILGGPVRQCPRVRCYVPPVGVEPTLGTLLGGRPLPLGYGGFMRIPRTVPINAGAADYCGLDPRSISPI